MQAENEIKKQKSEIIRGVKQNRKREIRNQKAAQCSPSNRYSPIISEWRAKLIWQEWPRRPRPCDLSKASPSASGRDSSGQTPKGAPMRALPSWLTPKCWSSGRRRSRAVRADDGSARRAFTSRALDQLYFTMEESSFVESALLSCARRSHVHPR